MFAFQNCLQIQKMFKFSKNFRGLINLSNFRKSSHFYKKIQKFLKLFTFFKKCSEFQKLFSFFKKCSKFQKVAAFSQPPVHRLDFYCVLKTCSVFSKNNTHALLLQCLPMGRPSRASLCASHPLLDWTQLSCAATRAAFPHTPAPSLSHFAPLSLTSSSPPLSSATTVSANPS